MELDNQSKDELIKVIELNPTEAVIILLALTRDLSPTLEERRDKDLLKIIDKIEKANYETK